jgi:hypothetical protein
LLRAAPTRQQAAALHATTRQALPQSAASVRRDSVESPRRASLHQQRRWQLLWQPLLAMLVRSSHLSTVVQAQHQEDGITCDHESSSIIHLFNLHLFANISKLKTSYYVFVLTNDVKLVRIYFCPKIRRIFANLCF